MQKLQLHYLTNLQEKHTLITKFVNYHHSHNNKGFLKKEERVKGFFYFYGYAIIEES